MRLRRKWLFISSFLRDFKNHHFLQLFGLTAAAASCVTSTFLFVEHVLVIFKPRYVDAARILTFKACNTSNVYSQTCKFGQLLGNFGQYLHLLCFLKICYSRYHFLNFKFVLLYEYVLVLESSSQIQVLKFWSNNEFWRLGHSISG